MPVVVEIEQRLEPVLVIAPLSVLQVLNCYFAKRPVQCASEVSIPRHSIMEWRPSGNGFQYRLIDEGRLFAGNFDQSPRAMQSPRSMIGPVDRYTSDASACD